MSDAQNDNLLSKQLSQTSVADGPTNAESILRAFDDGASQKDRALATVTLSKAILNGKPDAKGTQLSQQLYETIGRALDHGREASVCRLLTTLATLSPERTSELLFDESSERKVLIHQIFPRVVQEDDRTLELLKAELVSTLANPRPTSAKLLKEAQVLHWLDASRHLDAEAPGLALIAALTQYKLVLTSFHQHPSTADDIGEPSPAPQSKQQREQAERSLMGMAKSHVVAADPQALQQESSRNILLAALEALSYLSAASADTKKSLVDDTPFIKALCRLPSTVGLVNQDRSVFPSRNTSGPSSSSSYNLEQTLSQADRRAQMKTDTVFQLALASTILNLVSYPPVLSAEGKQMDKLRKIANAKRNQQEQSQSSVAQNGDNEDAEDPEPSAAVDERSAKLVDAGAVQALTAFAVSAASQSSSAASSSSKVGQVVSEALLSLVTKQDKLHRGKMIQQGAAKSLLALSAVSIRRMSEEKDRDGAHDANKPHPLQRSSGGDAVAAKELCAINGLAKLCISTSPALVAGDASTATTVFPTLFATLLLHPASNHLQRFEALLALTNVASLSPEAASRVANGKMPSTKRSTLGSSSEADQPENVGDSLENMILLEDHAMLRRAAVELLCNLAQDGDVLRKWSGEEEMEKQKGAKTADSERGSRAKTRLHLLMALCAPGANASKRSSGNSESSMPMRMAASGALATLCSTAPACELVLGLEHRTLNIIARLLKPGTPVQPTQRNGAAKIKEIAAEDADLTEGKPHEELAKDLDEDEEAELEKADMQSWPQGSAHARSSLAFRAASIVHCLVQYLAWRQDNGGAAAVTHLKTRITDSGIAKALEEVMVQGLAELKKGAPAGESAVDREARGMMGEVTRISVDCIKVLRSL